MSPSVFKILRKKEDWNVFAFICMFVHIKLSENRYGMCIYGMCVFIQFPYQRENRGKSVKKVHEACRCYDLHVLDLHFSCKIISWVAGEGAKAERSRLSFLKNLLAIRSESLCLKTVINISQKPKLQFS